MTFSEFKKLVLKHPQGVVLLEGRRAIPLDMTRKATALAAALARGFPGLRFRSGNAPGADQAFSEGVAKVAADRLQVVVPYKSHRKSARFPGATYTSLETLSPARQEALAEKTALASPKSKGLIALRDTEGPMGAKAAYLIRDTMKVTGHSRTFPKPFCALFYVDPSDPMAGGTGHTIRVCQQEGVPFVFQDSWGQWIVE